MINDCLDIKMAKSQVVANLALKKLEDQLTCAVCLNAFKEPKLLLCFHVFCKECLLQLMTQDEQGQFRLRCPTCRQSTILPSNSGVSSLQPAFHIHHLLEIQEALEKVSDPEKVVCEKCVKTPRIATNFCRDCGKFICDMCSTTHSEWEEFSDHEVVSFERVQSNVKQLVSPKKIILYCQQHKGMKLDLYCETCGELICLHCTVKKHKDHQIDLVSDTFDKHQAEITTGLEPVDKQLEIVEDAVKGVGAQKKEVYDQEVDNKSKVEQQIQKLHELIEVRKAQLFDDIELMTQEKIKNLEAQENDLDTVKTKLTSCRSFVRDSLRTGSQGEVMKMKNTVIKQLKDITSNFKPDILPPCEPANVKFVSSLLPITSQLQQFGTVVLQHTSPENCYAKGRGLERAEPGKRATAVLHVVDHNGKACSTPVETVTCELVSEITGEKRDCSVKKTEDSQYEISYQPTRRGMYQLHIKVEGENIKGSPFPVTVLRKFGIPIKSISGVSGPCGVAVNKRGEVIVAERNGHCVSIFSPAGEKLRTFGVHGSGLKEIKKPSGVVVDDDGNILVTDSTNNCIKKFTRYGQIAADIGKRGSKALEFTYPIGIAIHPHHKNVHVVDNNNHRIQVLNSDLTFSNTFGGRIRETGSNKQFYYPWDVAFDSSGKVYVADCSNHCIQVLSENGKILRKFGEKGSGEGELNKPSFITIDSYDVVYVTESGNDRVSIFTCEGKFLTSFGTKGSGLGQFNCPRGIAVDKNGVIYVSDSENNRIQLF